MMGGTHRTVTSGLTRLWSSLPSVAKSTSTTLAEGLAVSTATIRRDLDHLAHQQFLTRTRGGAVAQQRRVRPAAAVQGGPPGRGEAAHRAAVAALVPPGHGRGAQRRHDGDRGGPCDGDAAGVRAASGRAAGSRS